MTVDERARLELYQRLEQILGEEATGTLMGYLPAVASADLATKADLDRLESRIDEKLTSLKHELSADFHRELTAQTRTMIFSVLGALVGLSGLAVALSRAG